MRLSSTRDRAWLRPAIIALLIFGVFFRSLSFGFSWLDNLQIERHSCIIKDQQDLKDAFFSPLTGAKGESSYYRPLFKLSYTLDYIIYGSNPLGFRITNILLHITNLILLYFILLKFKIKESEALLAAIFYGVLPLNVSTVVSLAARADLLAALFIFISSLFYLKFQYRARPSYLVLSLLGYLSALMSKEIAFPFFLIIILISYIRKRFKFQSILYLFLVLSYLFIRLRVLGYMGSSEDLFSKDLAITGLSSFAGLYTYISKFFIPINLSLSDAFLRHSSIFNFKVILGIALFLLFFSGSVYFTKRKSEKRAFLLSWVLVFYIPISNIVPSPHFWAERFFYLPGVGLAVLTVYLLSKRRASKSFLIALILTYGIININYQGYFKDNETIFKRALDISAESEEAYNMLGYHHLLCGNYYKAIYYYHMAAQDFSRYYTYSSPAETYNNLGVLLLRLKQYQESRKWFKSVEGAGDNSDAVLNLKILDHLEGVYDQ